MAGSGAIILRKEGRVLVAEDARSIGRLAKIKDGKEVLVEVTTPRNPKHQRLFEVLITKVAESGAWELSREALRDWCKFRTGHVNKFEIDGKLWVTPKSISPASMTQADFKEFFDRAIFYICREILGTDEWDTLRNEVEEACRDRRLDGQEQAFQEYLSRVGPPATQE